MESYVNCVGVFNMLNVLLNSITFPLVIALALKLARLESEGGALISRARLNAPEAKHPESNGEGWR